MGCAIGNPVVGNRLRTEDPVTLYLPSSEQLGGCEVRVDVFPNNFTFWRNLKNAPIHTLINHGIAIGQAAGATNEGTIKPPVWLTRIQRGVLPDESMLAGEQRNQWLAV